LGFVLVPLAAACAVAAFAFLRLDPQEREKPLEVEQEPNNTATQANRIGLGKTVRGQIGRKQNAEESDRDFYKFTVGRGPHVLHVDLTGIPNIDLRLEVFDPQGKKIAEAEDLGPGQSETVPDVRLDGAGEYYVTVRELWVAGRLATENEVDWYTLKAEWEPLTENQGAEPNDTPDHAVPMPLDHPIRAYAGRANDVDYYYLRGAGGGTLSGSVSGIDGVALRVVVLPPGSTAGPPGPLPPGARVFAGGGRGKPVTFDGVAWASGAASPLLVVERLDGKPDPQGRWRDLAGMDVPYSLNVRLTR
jgi:hypothetical protein